MAIQSISPVLQGKCNVGVYAVNVGVKDFLFTGAIPGGENIIDVFNLSQKFGIVQRWRKDVFFLVSVDFPVQPQFPFNLDGSYVWIRQERHL